MFKINAEKIAKELIDKFLHVNRFAENSEGYFASIHTAKECALIACDLLKEHNKDLDIESIKIEINKYE